MTNDRKISTDKRLASSVFVAPDLCEPRPFTLSNVQSYLVTRHDTGEIYRIDIALPDEVAAGARPEAGWPAIYLLDAGGCFATCVEAVRRMGRRPDATGVEPLVVVGISSDAADYDVPRRQRDFTTARPIDESVGQGSQAVDASPPAEVRTSLGGASRADKILHGRAAGMAVTPRYSESSHARASAASLGMGIDVARTAESGREQHLISAEEAKNSGGAADNLASAQGHSKRPHAPHGHGGASAFLDFIVRQIMPLAQAQAKVDKARQTLFGHSLAGYFTLWTLANRPHVFRGYAAISPSVWWDVGGLRHSIAQMEPDERSVFICVGEWEDSLPPWQKRAADSEGVRARRAARGMVAGAQAIAEQLAGRLGSARVAFRLMDEEDHASIVSAAIPRALRLASQI